jgi:multicomponent Na+:H+ antiporter subunit E
MVGRGRRRAVIGRLASASGFVALWVVLAGRDLPYAPLVAAGAVAVAVLVSAALRPQRRWRVRPLGALQFLAYFIWTSLVGGVDVARRALAPKLDIEPELQVFELEASAASVALFIGTLSLVPGTLCAEVDSGRVTVHVIDRKQDITGRLGALERRVARVFAATRRQGA